MIRYSYQVLGFLFFIWSFLNFMDGINGIAQHHNQNTEILNICKGIVGMIIAGYFYYIGNNVDLRYKK